MRPAVTAVVTFLAVALLASACGGEDESPFPPFAATSPIEELLGAPIDPVEAAAWDEALIQISITNCMADAGHAYQPDPTLLAFQPEGMVPGAAPPGPEVADIDDARSMLSWMTSEYEIALLPEEDQSSARAAFDPNFDATRTDAERDTYWQDLTGGPTGPGCLQNSESAPLADPNRDGGLIAQFNQAAETAYAADPDVIAGAEAWRTCMTDAGYDYSSPADAERQLRGQAAGTSRLTDEEVAAGDAGSVVVQARIVDELTEIAALEAEVAATSQGCATEWLVARAAVRAAVADDFVERFG